MEANQGVTRRQALKRGLVIGTGVVWATPMIQVIRMSEAYAQITSLGPGQKTQPPGNGVAPGDGVSPGNGGTPGNGGGLEPPDEVEGIVITQPPQVSSPPPQVSSPPPQQVAPKVVTPPSGVAVDVTAETLPLTGMDVAPLAALGSGLLAAGAASLKIAKQVKDAEAPAPEEPWSARHGEDLISP